MQNKIISKALSLTAAAVLSCTAVIGSGSWITASANIAVGDYSGDAMQKVIVKVSGDAVLATAEGEALGTDFLDTEAAAAVEGQIESVQARVQRSIREFYPELAVTFSYSTLFNGFYCELPESLVKYVREVPLVESVTVVPENVGLRMATAPDFSDYPAYYNTTGCTGEGQVVCVIDSEIDVTHPMFAPLADDIETKLSKDDIAEIIASGELNIQVDADVAYRSSKLPFVVDYVDDDQDAGLLFPEMYHGTHVSGIAAGNQIEDEDGKTISGIARDAQLIFLSIGSRSFGGIDFGAAIAATEDAVKLKADVINMSWGTDCEFFGSDPFAECIAAAQNAGVMVCIAAGNADNGADSYWRTLTPDNPDTGTMSDKIEKGSSELIVASADNLHSEDFASVLVGDRRIKVSGYIDGSVLAMFNMFDILEKGDYEYVYVGAGNEADFEGVDLTGKIAMIDSPVGDDPEANDKMLQSALATAQGAGAVGVIVIDIEGAEDLSIVWTDAGVPSCYVTYEDGQFLIENENKVITNDGEMVTVDYPSEVSFYTSWGVRQNLELRPDIMGIGGYVESAAYDGKEEIMSGTSMATPYMCGCVAELCQYLREKGIELTGAEKTQFIHNILMNSAVPYTANFPKGTMYVTPRRQGAGMVNLNNVIRDKVLMTGDEGSAKINLYDNLSDTFSFNVNLQNLSDEDVVFTNARLELTTDDYTHVVYNEINFEMDVIENQQQLTSSADLSGLLQVPAGDTKTAGVQVSLDAAQTAEISEVFTNGFFVEGYLFLEGAENCSDISIPLLGYYGDWAQLPIVSADGLAPAVQMGDGALSGGYSLARTYEAIKEIMEDMAAAAEREEEWVAPEFPDTSTGITYVSPNGDGLADHVGLNGEAKRQCQYTITVKDSKGKVVAQDDGMLQDKYVDVTAATEQLYNDLPEGEYTIEVKANIDYPTSYENPQVYTGSFTIDKTAPEVTTDIVEKNGRTILKLTCSDNKYLDCIAVLGNGNGGVVGSFDPENDWFGMEKLEYVRDAIEQISVYGSFKAREYDYDNLSVLGLMLAGRITEEDLGNYSFFDFIPADTDGNGKFTVEYDITDLLDYSITVVDGAYNLTDIGSEKAPRNFMKNGIWAGKNGFYDFTDFNVKFTDIYDNSSVSYSYTLENNVLTLTNRRGSETIQVTPIDETHVRFTYENGETVLMSYENIYTQNVRSVWDLEDAVKNFMESNVPDSHIEKISTMVYDQDDIRITVTIKDPVEEFDIVFICSIFSDYADTPFSYFPINIFEETLTKIKPGTYYSIDESAIHYVVFNTDEKTGYWYGTDTDEVSGFSYAYNEKTQKFDFTFDGEEEPAVFSGKITSDAADGIYIYEQNPQGAIYGDVVRALYYYSEYGMDPFSLHSSDEIGEMLCQYLEAVTGIRQEVTGVSTMGLMLDFSFSDAANITIDPFMLWGQDYDGYTVDLAGAVPTLAKGAMSIETLKEWAVNDYELKNGIAPAGARARIIENNRVAVVLTDDYGNKIDAYELDAISAVGTNQFGEAVNLPETGSNAPASAATAAAAVVMMMIGLGTAAGSGVLRRKKDCE